MPKQITDRTRQRRESLAHMWVAAAVIEVEEPVAKRADHRGYLTVAADARIDVLEVYCRNCHQPYKNVSEADCKALTDNQHLIGGNQSQRAKRKIPRLRQGARVLSGGRIQRHGIDAYVKGVSRPAR
ncbi:hypothetical protein ABZW47_18515 [Streptomyces sp. NPDC004549]|uniref:hypothetical protein n=1 Tax=Streptomyces sp. NPDC004549 TaxID=3154283 RepID=UPI0033B1A024